MTVLEETRTAVGVQYRVTVDGADLGAFSTCDGLGVEVVIETREEGGTNGFVHQLPTRVKYPNIKLSRPLGAGSAKVAAWVSSVANGYTRTTCQIVVTAVDGTTIASWSLAGVVPVRWTGPQLQSDGTKVLTEQLEIAHHGFSGGGA
ncbi:phage tail protein [Miniimonas arenae]|uniref:Phage tail protein n=1 Tax=Miniimonas arenae TaxID=676201 RepID=A0A5C5BBP7_9MICO|nr:phage tail protein [Miniimonas arenae]TNU73296.1 phage tail protein [Miniimonas arenae]